MGGPRLSHPLLLEKAHLTFPGALAFSYCAGQVTMHEWDASGVRMPRTPSEMSVFDLAAFGRTVSQLNPSLFRRFRAKDLERYTSKLLVHPSMILGPIRRAG